MALIIRGDTCLLGSYRSESSITREYSTRQFCLPLNKKYSSEVCAASRYGCCSKITGSGAAHLVSERLERRRRRTNVVNWRTRMHRRCSCPLQPFPPQGTNSYMAFSTRSGRYLESLHAIEDDISSPRLVRRRPNYSCRES